MALQGQTVKVITGTNAMPNSTRNSMIDLNDLLTIRDVCAIFEVSEVTVHRWRDERGLDTCIISIAGDVRPAIRYSLSGVLKWAEEGNVKMPGYQKWLKSRKLA